MIALIGFGVANRVLYKVSRTLFCKLPLLTYGRLAQSCRTTSLLLEYPLCTIHHTKQCQFSIIRAYNHSPGLPLLQMALVPMGNYVFFLAQFQTFGYCAVYFAALAIRYR